MVGIIGKVVMVGVIVVMFVVLLGLGEGFILENVCYELLIVLIFILLFLGFFLLMVNLVGMYGLFIFLILIVVVVGGYLMVFGLLIGVFGLLFVFSKGGSLLVGLISWGVCGGLLFYFGFIGMIL